MTRISSGLPHALAATCLATSLTGVAAFAFATEPSQQRQQARDVKQDTRQESRQEKIDCRQENNKSNAACRKHKRDSMQDGRQQVHDIKY